jgi:hypothetical protein
MKGYQGSALPWGCEGAGRTERFLPLFGLKGQFREFVKIYFVFSINQLHLGTWFQGVVYFQYMAFYMQ